MKSCERIFEVNYWKNQRDKLSEGNNKSNCQWWTLWCQNVNGSDAHVLRDYVSGQKQNLVWEKNVENLMQKFVDADCFLNFINFISLVFVNSWPFTVVTVMY